MTLEQFKNLKIGDVLRSTATGGIYTVADVKRPIIVSGGGPPAIGLRMTPTEPIWYPNNFFILEWLEIVS